MNCLCKCIGSSCVGPITSNVHTVRQVMRSPSWRGMHAAPLLFRCSVEVSSFRKLLAHHEKVVFGFQSLFFASAQCTFTPTRSLSSDVKTRAKGAKIYTAKPKKEEVNAIKDSWKSSLKAKTKNSDQKVQAKSKRLARQTQTENKSSVKQHVLDEQTDFEEELNDDEDVDDEDFDYEELESELTDSPGAGGEGIVDPDDAFIDDILAEEGEDTEDIVLGDGGDGGGVNISQAQWGEQALSIVKSVLEEFGSNFSLYAFKTSFDNRIYVRLDKLSDKYGSPSMVEIESFSTIYGKRLEEAGQSGILPDNIAFEVSSPGAERVVQVPDQLERFKGLPMLVRYEAQPAAAAADNESKSRSSPVVKDGIWEIASFDTCNCVWKLANVRANREQAGKGRGLTKKQKDWRMELPFSSLCLVRLYMDI